MPSTIKTILKTKRSGHFLTHLPFLPYKQTIIKNPQQAGTIMNPLKALRDIWETHIRPVIAPEPKLNLFGVRYNKMQAVFATLGPAEKGRIEFFIAAASEEKPVKDYIDYIRHLERFCDLCVRQPDSALTRGLDMAKIMEFKTSVDLLMGAVRGSDKTYLDRVRADMWVPDFTQAQEKVRRAEIGMLKEDIANSGGPRLP